MTLFQAIDVLVFLLIAHVFGEDRAIWLFCRLHGHTWADTYRYGVQPICVACGTARGGE